jgi:hypothetical protein
MTRFVSSTSRCVEVRPSASRDARSAAARVCLVFAAFGAFAAPRYASAAERAGDLGEAPLTLRADRIDVDRRSGTVALDGGVELQLDGFVVRSEHLSLRRSVEHAARVGLVPPGDAALGGSGPLKLDGRATFAPCPCASPPLSLSIAGARRTAGGDWVLRQPVVRLFGLPVGWLPLFWLRSPESIGLLPPELAWSGVDGLYGGLGLHLPLGRRLDLGFGLFESGAMQGALDFGTDHARARLRWNHRDVGGPGSPAGDGVSIDAEGWLSAREDDTLAPLSTPTLAFDVDALAGARASRMAMELSTIAMPWNELLATARLGPGRWSVEAWSPRGAPLDRVSAIALRTGVARDGAVGEIGAWHLAIGGGPRASATRRPEAVADAAWTMAVARPLGWMRFAGELSLDARIGRFGGTLDSSGESGGTAAASPASSGAANDARSIAPTATSAWLAAPRVALALPLERPGAVRMELTPLVEARAGAMAASGDDRVLDGWAMRGAFVDPWSSDHRLAGDPRAAGVAAIGLDGRVDERDEAGRTHGELRLRAGGYASSTSGVESGLDVGAVGIAAMSGSLRRERADALSAALDVDAAITEGQHAAGPGELLVVRGTLDLPWLDRRGLHLGARLAARSTLEPLLALALFGPGFYGRSTSQSGLLREGVTVGGGASFPVASSVRIGGEVDVDARGPTLLQASAEARWTHRCGCLAVSLRGGHLIGRDGIDVLASIEVPHGASR